MSSFYCQPFSTSPLLLSWPCGLGNSFHHFPSLSTPLIFSVCLPPQSCPCMVFSLGCQGPHITEVYYEHRRYLLAGSSHTSERADHSLLKHWLLLLYLNVANPHGHLSSLQYIGSQVFLFIGASSFIALLFSWWLSDCLWAAASGTLSYI